MLKIFFGFLTSPHILKCSRSESWGSGSNSSADGLMWLFKFQPLTFLLSRWLQRYVNAIFRSLVQWFHDPGLLLDAPGRVDDHNTDQLSQTIQRWSWCTHSSKYPWLRTDCWGLRGVTRFWCHILPKYWMWSPRNIYQQHKNKKCLQYGDKIKDRQKIIAIILKI